MRRGNEQQTLVLYQMTITTSIPLVYKSILRLTLIQSLLVQVPDVVMAHTVLANIVAAPVPIMAVWRSGYNIISEVPLNKN